MPVEARQAALHGREEPTPKGFSIKVERPRVDLRNPPGEDGPAGQLEAAYYEWKRRDTVGHSGLESGTPAGLQTRLRACLSHTTRDS